MNNEVNKSYVLALEEQSDKTLRTIRIPINQRTEIISHMKTMSESFEYNIYEMSKYFETQISCGEKIYKYCYPSEYSHAFLNEQYTTRPQCINPLDYCSKEKKSKESWERYSHGTKTDEDWKKHVHFLEKGQKKKFFHMAEKYINCISLDETFNTLNNNPSIRTYSTEIVGFKHFLYKINEEVDVDVFTNFGYGKKSFLKLTIKYKDIVLIPYTDLVNFYYANMIDFIQNTKSYAPRRENWISLMEYLSDFVNKSRNNSKDFIRNFVLNEVEGMMNGLQQIVSDSQNILEKIKDVKSHIRIGIVSPFSKNDFLMYEAMPNELARIFRVEKTTGALHFIENLKSLEDICPEVNETIDRIIQINKTTASDIPLLINSVQENLNSISKELNEITVKLRKLEKEEERFNSKLDRCLSFYKDNSMREERKERFIKENPRCELVQNEINEKLSEVYEKQAIIDSREKFLERLGHCRAIAEKYEVI